MSLELLAIEGVLLLGSWAYHRWGPQPEGPAPQDEIQIPLTADGTPYPLIYGRCRVREPILAWSGDMVPEPDPDDGGLESQSFWQGAPFRYRGLFFFNIGIGFQCTTGHQPGNYIYSIYAGDDRLSDGPFPLLPPNNYVRLSELVGTGNYESAYATGPRPCWIDTYSTTDKGPEYLIRGQVEFYNGSEDQQLVNETTPFVATTIAGERMGETGDASEIPGFLGMISIFLGGQDLTGSGGSNSMWDLGSSGRMQAMSFEVASYPTLNFGSPMIGVEANPIDVMFDLITGKRGKLGLPQSMIDTTSWQAAADTCYAEGNGYSRAIPNGRARDQLREILVQIDGVIRPNYATNKIEIKLIRPDFNPRDIPHITVHNCSDAKLVEAFGWTGLPNRFRLLFQDRANNYQDNSATAANEGNAYDQGDAEEVQIQMPGVCTLANAVKLVSREASIRSMPLMKLRVTVDRSFLRVGVGDAVAMTWPPLGIAGAIFRVATPARGGRDDNSIDLDLIQDAGYTHRWETSDTSGLPSHPTEAVG